MLSAEDSAVTEMSQTSTRMAAERVGSARSSSVACYAEFYVCDGVLTACVPHIDGGLVASR
jgi:hypothetical protein